MVEPTPVDLNRPQPVPLIPMPDRDQIGLTLPISLASFVGREREVAAIVDLLGRDGVRLVTLTGPGGVGKTRLALRVAEQLAPNFGAGVVFVPLAALADPDLVLPSVGQALGIREGGDPPLATRLSRALRDRHLLLLLDNFEHLLDAAPLVADILSSCPRLTALITSQALLRVSGEQVYPVLPLALPYPTDDEDQAAEAEAVQLFSERARAADPSFTLTTTNLGPVVRICRRLDGLPLAIELAAAKTRVLTPSALLGRLDRQLGVLTGGARDHPARLQTMRNAIAWTHDFLISEEQTLFRRLAIFAGGCTLEAAEAVAGSISPAATTVLDGVAVLVDHSMVRTAPQANGQPRYEMLETIREFGLERLAEAGEEDTVQNAHAAYFLDFAEQTDLELARFLPTGDQVFDRVEADLPNLRAALAWLEQSDPAAMLHLAGTLAPFWGTRGYLREGHDWLERALARTSDSPERTRALALFGLALLTYFEGDDRRGADLTLESLALWRDLNDARGTMLALRRAGIIALSLGQFERAETCQREALAILETLPGEPWSARLASTLHGDLGNITIGYGDLDKAESLFNEALERQRVLGHQPGTSHIYASHPLAGLGDVARGRGDPGRALHYYQQSLTCAWHYRDMRAVGYALTGVAAASAAVGQWEVAARLFGASEAIHDASGLSFDRGSMDRQRALGLPEPWLRSTESFGSGQALRDALMAQRAVAIPPIPDLEAAARLWSQGRDTLAERAIADATGMELSASSVATLDPGLAHGLTRREIEVLRMVAEGRSDREIADALFLSYRTVTSYVTSILGKLGVDSRTAAATYAVRHGLA